MLDLDGKGLEGLDRSSGVEAVVEREPRRGVAGLRLPDRDDRPLAGDLRPRRSARRTGPHDPIDLRLFLRHEEQAMSETWIYQAFPSQLHALLGEHA